MTISKSLFEPRDQKRLKVKAGAFVILRPSNVHVGRLLDVNMHGLTFEYVCGEEPSSQPNELEIFEIDSAFRVNKIPCRIVDDLTVYKNPLTSTNRRRCNVKFDELTPDQICLLGYFIQNHTAGEAEI